MSWIKEYVRTIPDYPHEGIMFRDVTTIFQSEVAYPRMIDEFIAEYKNKNITKVAGIEARGFILGGAIAHALGLGFVTIRKHGKLPHHTYRQKYALEYGEDAIEIHKDGLDAGDRVLIVDDLIATGGTAIAAQKLIKQAGGIVSHAGFIIDLPELGGTTELKKHDCEVFTLAEFEGL